MEFCPLNFCQKRYYILFTFFSGSLLCVSISFINGICFRRLGTPVFGALLLSSCNVPLIGHSLLQYEVTFVSSHCFSMKSILQLLEQRHLLVSRFICLQQFPHDSMLKLQLSSVVRGLLYREIETVSNLIIEKCVWTLFILFIWQLSQLGLLLL